MTATLPGPGDRFGNYLIDSEIAKGGFSVVLRARAPDNSMVAIKILAPQTDTVKYSNNLAERFAREANLLAQVGSPFTVKLLEYGQDPQTSLLFMVFELVEGLSLFQLIKTGGPQPYTRMLAILKQCLLGLNRAHAIGILHRDLKPNNIMLFDDGIGGDRVKVIDFGIAKRWGDDAQDLTSAGVIVGTPRYMSPEQIRCADLGPASDIYSLGLCMVELLTARKAVWGKTRTDVITRQLDPNQTVPIPEDLPLPVRAIVSRMVAKVPQTRYQSADEVLADIDSFNQMSADQREGDTMYQPIDDEALSSMLVDMPKPPREDQTVLQSVRIDALPFQNNQGAAPDDRTVLSSDIDQTVLSQQIDQSQLMNDFRHRRDSSQHLPHLPVDDSQNWVGQVPDPMQSTPSSQRIISGPVAQQSAGISNSQLDIPREIPTSFSESVDDPNQANISTMVIANMFIPGSGHFILGYRPKGAIFLAAWFMFFLLSAMFLTGADKGVFDYVLGFLSGIVLLVVIAAATIDVWLTARSSRHREVKALEFLPDISDVMDRLK